MHIKSSFKKSPLLILGALALCATTAQAATLVTSSVVNVKAEISPGSCSFSTVPTQIDHPGIKTEQLGAAPLVSASKRDSVVVTCAAGTQVALKVVDNKAGSTHPDAVTSERPITAAFGMGVHNAKPIANLFVTLTQPEGNRNTYYAMSNDGTTWESHTSIVDDSATHHQYTKAEYLTALAVAADPTTPAALINHGFNLRTQVVYPPAASYDHSGDLVEAQGELTLEMYTL
ncbi:hypothetical protein SAMN04515618_102335 [Collimonas sp. OK307]|uniref:hypothetical protein n=1 Tax=Collimonas sp. OK307 TaxID=1801620 RepID=UPI0008EA745F|nr:hypothetical protein [Collimonas sp. OK307]SFH75003.1 hypothetical protein SAMN04515618_102335 [Collimonas sp. OK307]